MSNPVGNARSDERSLGELFGDLASGTSHMVQQEVKLAVTEISEQAKYAGRKSVTIASGLLFGMLAMQALGAAAIVAIDIVLPLWAAAMIVGGALLLVAVTLALAGMAALKRMDKKPTQTILALEETRSWAKTQIN